MNSFFFGKILEKLLIVAVQFYYPGPGVAIFFPLMGRVSLSREVVHPEMMGRRAVFCGMGGTVYVGRIPDSAGSSLSIRSLNVSNKSIFLRILSIISIVSK
jgi:hypothetical protein